MNRYLRSFAFLTLMFAGASVPLPVAAQNQPPAGRPRNFPGHGARPGMPPNAAAHPALPMVSPSKEVVKTTAGEQFFIVASIDRQNSQLLLKRPTEVTVLVKISPQTKYLDENGKPVKLSDFRAGDTVWARVSSDKADPTVLQMRLGEMTVADLHRYYLDYPAVK
jgi:hypothetical protein